MKYLGNAQVRGNSRCKVLGWDYVLHVLRTARRQLCLAQGERGRDEGHKWEADAGPQSERAWLRYLHFVLTMQRVGD